MMNPFFSIIIPAYNVERYIETTLDSLAVQTFKSVELIVINDGSTDATLLTLEKKLSGSNLNYNIIDQINSGVSAARNNGLRVAKGRYIIFFDGDDFVESNYLQVFYDTVINSKCEIAFCKYKKVDEQHVVLSVNYPASAKIKYHNSSRSVLIEYLKTNDIIMTGCIAYQRELLLDNKITFPTRLAYGEDQEFICKAIYFAKNIAFIDLFLFSYLQRKSSAVGSCKPYKIRDNIKSYANLLRFFRLKNENEYSTVLEEYKIPYNIVSVLRNYAKRENRMEFDRILSKRTLKYNLLKGLLGSKATIQLRIKILLILLLPCCFYYLLAKKKLNI